MVEIFDEIEVFFQQEQFSQEQLDALKEAVEIKYKDNHTRKLATSAINIKLLQYQLSGPLVARVNEKIKRAKQKLKSKTISTLSKSKKPKNTRPKKSKVQILDNTNKSQKPPKDRVKPKKIIKRSDNNKKSTPGVWGKLVKAKTIGSIIYTRMS